MPATHTYTDGDYSVAVAVSLPVFSAPFLDLGVKEKYVLTQNWCQALASYAPLALDTAHPDYPDYLLTGESDLQDLGGGIVQWTRTYAQTPSAIYRPGGNFSFTFPQIIGTTQIGPNAYGTIQRFAFTRNVMTKRVLEFYRTTNPLGDIPMVSQFRIYLSGHPTYYEYPFVTDANSWSGLTVPSQTQYAALVAADAATGDSYSLCAQASQVTQWNGNIYQREALYVKAL